MSTNSSLLLHFERISNLYNLKVVNSNSKIAFSSAVEAVWMGWELKNANEDVDISNCKIEAFERLPLGSYFEDILNEDKQGDKTIIKTGYVPDYRQKKQ